MIPENVIRSFDAGEGKKGFYYSLPALEEAGIGKTSQLPVSIRIVLESVLRNCDGKKVAEKDVVALANWNAKEPANEEIPFVVARIVLQDFTGVPLLVDLAAMRAAVAKLNATGQRSGDLVPYAAESIRRAQLLDHVIQRAVSRLLEDVADVLGHQHEDHENEQEQGASAFGRRS